MVAFMWLDLTPKGRHQFDDGRSRLSADELGTPGEAVLARAPRRARWRIRAGALS